MFWVAGFPGTAARAGVRSISRTDRRDPSQGRLRMTIHRDFNRSLTSPFGFGKKSHVQPSSFVISWSAIADKLQLEIRKDLTKNQR